MKVRVFIALLSMLAVTACASNGKHVPRNAKYQSVSYGVVLESEDVTIGGSNSGIGSYVGSTAAIYDSTSRSFLGLVVRGLVGGVVGASVEEGVTRQKGKAYTIEDANGKTVLIASENTELEKGGCVKIVHGGRSYTTIQAAKKTYCNSTQLAKHAPPVL